VYTPDPNIISIGISRMAHPQERIHQLAKMTWDSMRTHFISPTPRNYDLWYTHCSGDNPALSRSIDAIIQAGSLITPRGLDEAYREFVAVPIDLSTVRDASSDLQKVAGEMSERVTTDRTKLSAAADALSEVSNHLSHATSPTDLLRAAAAASTAAHAASEQLRVMESLFTTALSDITGLCGRLAKADHEATRDALTGLANRRMFDASIQRAAAEAAAGKSDLSLLLIDIDHFKRFNQLYGHPMGDNLVRLLGRRVTDQARGRDTAARFGGDKFALIMPGSSLSEAIAMSEQIRQDLERRPVVNRNTGQSFGMVTCSIGVAFYRQDEAAGDLVDRVELALHQSKLNGRNTVRAEVRC